MCPEDCYGHYSNEAVSGLFGWCECVKKFLAQPNSAAVVHDTHMMVVRSFCCAI